MKVLFNTIKDGEMSGALTGHCQWLERFLVPYNCKFVVTDWAEIFYQHLPTADIVITQGFTGAPISDQQFQSAENLQLVVVAGPYHHHVEHNVLLERSITMAKIPNTSAVTNGEQQLLAILQTVRKFGDDLQGKTVGVIGAGVVGRRLVELLQPFGVSIRYFDQHQWEPSEEQQYNMTWFPTVEMTVEDCDIVVSNCPLEYEGILNTANLFTEPLISQMKPGAILLVSSPEPTIDRQAVNKALDRGHLAYFAGPNILNRANRTYQLEISAHIKSILEHWFGKIAMPDAWLLTHQGQRGLQPGCDCFNLAGWHA